MPLQLDRVHRGSHRRSRWSYLCGTKYGIREYGPWEQSARDAVGVESGESKGDILSIKGSDGIHMVVDTIIVQTLHYQLIRDLRMEGTYIKEESPFSAIQGTSDIALVVVWSIYKSSVT